MDLRKVFLRIKQISKKLSYRYKLNSFYLYNGPAPSILARLLNLIFTETLLVLLCYIWFLNRLNRPLIALILTIVLTFLLNLSYWMHSGKQLNKKRYAKRKQVARDYSIDMLIRQGPDEFKWQILRLVLKIPGSGSIKAKDGFLETTIKGRRMAVGFFNDRFADDVSPQILSMFIGTIKAAGYSEAIYLTTGLYSDKCKDYVKKIKKLKLHLLNRHNLLDIMESVGMVPDEGLIDVLVKRKLEHSSRDYSRLRKEILAPKRTRSYLGYAIFFTIASVVVNIFKLYYIIFAALFIVLALISWFRTRTKPNAVNDKAEIIDELVS